MQMCCDVLSFNIDNEDGFDDYGYGDGFGVDYESVASNDKKWYVCMIYVFLMYHIDQNGWYMDL